jgi:dipeptidyl aminopeptidase/acylaminoacyl peptidase
VIQERELPQLFRKVNLDLSRGRNSDGDNKVRRWAWFLILGSILVCGRTIAGQSLRLQDVLKAPFPENLVAAKTGNRIAWTMNQEGRRNIWVTEGPDFAARQLTHYDEDDGEELSGLEFSADGKVIVFVRGEGKDSAGDYANPTSNPAGTEETVWMVSWEGSAPVKVDAGSSPKLSREGKIAYARGGQMWIADLAGKEKPKQVVVRGKNAPLGWSPAAENLLFVSERGDHTFIGIYDNAAQGVKFIAPSVDTDSDAVWSTDGKRVAFVRQPAQKRDAPQGYFIQPDKPRPWAIWVGDAQTGNAHLIWQSGMTAQDSFPYMAADTGGGALNWANDSVLFASEQDGWQHLYSISANSGKARLLTPGECEVEQWWLSADARTILFNSNCGDIDRRHLWKMGSDGSDLQALTKGEGIEWAGRPTSDGRHYAYFGSDAQNRGIVFVKEYADAAKTMAVTAEPAGFPAEQFAAPQQVLFKSGDGMELHGQLYLPKNLKAGDKPPALIFLHGGPMRQMLLGWHYMYYYSNSYGMNQYLASRGYIVLAVNYRSGVGYGRAFREAQGRAGRGATEYQDVLAAGKYLRGRDDVDGKRIGLWGGSYGGYLTALGLGWNSDVFAAGVDMHGVHDWPTDNWEGKNISAELTKLAHESSPVATVETWKSPVLFIHGDDDRNVIFSQTVDLVARLREKGVVIEQLVFPDEVHDFLLYRSWIKAYEATSEFFDRQFQMPPK